ncbi:hypothetical protein SAMN05216404_11812 [Nitrosospira multiformis]|uniref:Glycosyl hydrolase family 43 n=1 Tax=Nitrosospira multiformis TaxID=1231 RepID=A0A1H8NXK8_9PROT|nr:hypothetical protein [Nitrosospira multiformis]SEO34311.1 hypothetical protein SAMN05216404_11812 [Nitrosospira multiformis]
MISQITAVFRMLFQLQRVLVKYYVVMVILSTITYADVLKASENSGTNAVVVRPGYDYAAALMNESESNKIWWCGNLPGFSGDQILYLDNLDDQTHYTSSDERIKNVFSPSGNKDRFDSEHTCDPSVIRVDGHYYMYYSGIDVLKKRILKLPNPTAIGVAVSMDGLHWTRENDGVPIVKAVSTTEGKRNTYGAGQPAVVFVSPYYYMLFTDTTAPIAGSNIGANLFVIRSRDPLFSTFEELLKEGFMPTTNGEIKRNYRVVDGFTAEMVFIEEWNLFMVAVNREPGATWLYFFNRDFQPVSDRVSVENQWSEGPGILRDELGHIRPASNGMVTLTIISPVGDRKKPQTWDLYSTVVELERIEEPLTIKIIPGASIKKQ